MKRLIATLAVAAAVLVPGAPADAAVSAEVAETGWWSQRPGATEQDGNGVEVAAALGAEQSVAALRIVVSGGEVTTATLTLEETGGVGQETASLTLCPTKDTWKAANPGPYGEAPEPDCNASVELSRADDGATWTADIGILLSAAETSLVIVPGTEGPSGLPVGPGYQVTFGKATVEAAGGDIGSIGLAPPEPEQTSPGDIGETDPGGTGADVGGAPSAPAPSGSDPSFDAGTPAPEAAPAGGDAAAAPTDAGTVPLDTGAAGGGDASGAPEGVVDNLAGGPVAADGGSTARWGRLVFLVPLSALVGAAVAYGRPWLREHDLGRFLPG